MPPRRSVYSIHSHAHCGDAGAVPVRAARLGGARVARAWRAGGAVGGRGQQSRGPGARERGTNPEPGRRCSWTLSMVAVGTGFRKATESAFRAESTASTVTVNVKMAFSRNVHECIAAKLGLPQRTALLTAPRSFQPPCSPVVAPRLLHAAADGFTSFSLEKKNKTALWSKGWAAEAPERRRRRWPRRRRTLAQSSR